MSIAYKLDKGQRYLACAWRDGPHYVVVTKGFKELDSARRWSRRMLEVGYIEIKDGKKPLRVGLGEVGILMKNKRRKDWPWDKIETITGGPKERMREAAKRAAAEKGNKR